MADAVRTLPTPITLADFDVGVTLGTGSFGRVRFATHKVLILHRSCFFLPSLHIPPLSNNFFLQSTKSFWAIKMLKKAEVIRLQQVSSYLLQFIFRFLHYQAHLHSRWSI